MKSINDMPRHALMLRLMFYRVRSPDIAAYTGLSVSHVKRSYRDHYGSGAAPVGTKPADYKFFIQTKKRQRESMHMMHLLEHHGLQMYERPGLDRNSIEGGNALIDAYEMFLQQNEWCREDTSFTLERAIQFHHFLEKGVLTVQHCDRCGAGFAVHFEHLHDKNCIFCQVAETGLELDRETAPTKTHAPMIDGVSFA